MKNNPFSDLNEDFFNNNPYDVIKKITDLKNIYESYISTYGDVIGQIYFRIHCIKNSIDFKGFDDYRSLEILLDNINLENISIECFLYHQDVFENKKTVDERDDPKKLIQCMKDGYKVLLKKVWK